MKVSKSKTLMISGYYGFDNAGDEAILASMIQQFKEQIDGVRIIVLSESPDKTASRYQVESHNRRDFGGIFRLMGEIDLFISGGGGLVQDSTGFATVVYYLGMVQMARLRGKKVMLYGQGLGPLNFAKSRMTAKFVMNQASLVTFRDENSKKLAEAVGIRKPPVHVTGDPVFALKAAGPDEIDKAAKDAGISEEGPKIGISVRPWPTSAPFTDHVAAAADYLAEKYNAKIYLFPFQFSQDLDICRDVQQKMKSPAVLVDKNLPVTVLAGLLGQMDFTLGMRLHSLIFSGSQGVPSAGISYDPKVRHTMDLLGMPWLDIQRIDGENLKEMAEKTFTERDSLKKGLLEKAQVLKEKALENTRLLKELLNS